MKILNNFEAISRIFIGAVTLSVILVSCVKKDDNVPQSLSGLSVIHASPTTEKLDVFVGNTKINNGDVAYTNKIDYLDVYSGSRKITITKKGITTPTLAETFTFNPQVGYSLFVVDKFETVKFLLLTDDLSAPATGKAKVRFVNLSPDAPALNLAVVGKTDDLFTNKLFKEYTSFTDIDAAEKVTFNVKNKETSVIEATIADVKIESGKIYTIWAKGLKAATDDKKIGIAVFTHK